MNELLLCKENILYPRLKEKEVKWGYLILFKELVIFMQSDNALVSDCDLEEIWPFVNRATRYRALKHFEDQQILIVTKDKKDKRNRLITILISYSDSFFKVLVI